MEIIDSKVVLKLLNKLMDGDSHLTEEESKTLLDIKKDINDYVDHWDEGEEKKHSPFYYINTLNKMAKKTLFYDNVDLAKLSLLLKKIHGERYGFTPNILDKDSEGHFVTFGDTLEGKKLLTIDMSLSGFLDAFVDKVFEYHKVLGKIK